MIAFEGVTLRYPRAARPAVDAVSLDAAASRVTAIVGPNGSGKSTLVRGLLGRLPVEAGTIRIGGRTLDRLDRREAAQLMAVVTQREESIFPLAVREFVALGRYAHGGPLSREGAADRDAVVRALDRAGVAPLADRRTDALSGGEWQRVRLARALAQQSPAVVLDEPTTFLDVSHAMELFELLDSLAVEGHAVLVISHELNLVARFAAHLVLLHQGRTVAAGTPREVLRPEVLEPVYEWPLAVVRDASTDHLNVVPLRARDRGQRLTSSPDPSSA